MIKTTNRKALTGRIYNLQWYKLESLPLHPWRGEFTLIVDGATRRPEKLSCTVFGENASRLRLIDPPPTRITISGESRGELQKFGAVLMVSTFEIPADDCHGPDHPPAA